MTFRIIAISWAILALSVWTFALYKYPCIFPGSRCENFIHKQGELIDSNNPFFIRFKTDWLKTEATLIYPWEARTKEIEGFAIVEMLIDKDGKILNSRIIKSSENSLLDDAALKSIATFDVDPAKLSTDIFPHKKQIQLTFKLDD